MTRCLTQHQIDTALALVLAGACLAIVGAFGWFLAWSRPADPKPQSLSMRLLLSLPAVAWLGYMALTGRTWGLSLMVCAVVVIAPVAAVARRRSLALAGSVDMEPGWRRAHSIAKYVYPALATIGLLLSVGALAWVIPADLC